MTENQQGRAVAFEFAGQTLQPLGRGLAGNAGVDDAATAQAFEHGGVALGKLGAGACFNEVSVTRYAICSPAISDSVLLQA